MKQPKEIYIHKSELKDDFIKNGYYMALFSIEKHKGDLKYISEQHHLKQIEVLKKEIDELKERLKND